MFEFRLQKVLEYRERLEGQAKEAYLNSQASRLTAENGLDEIRARRGNLLESSPSDLDSRRALEATLISMDGEERAARVVLNVVNAEEETARNAWILAKRELEGLVRLRESALKEYELEENRREQRDMDEWAIMRRAA